MAYTLITTADGSSSYINTDFDEAYHSVHGAYSEALYKHVQACKLAELALNYNEINILDLCFGLGYNSGVAIEQITKINPECRINIVGLENDSGIITKIGELQVPESYKQAQAIIVAAANPVIAKQFTNTTQPVNIKLIIGDARTTIKQLEANCFDAVFFDPFSPRKCPELWQPEFIAEVVTKAKPGAYISTYSSARIAKDGFKAAGCSIQEGPSLGRRSGGVLACKLC